MAKVVLEIDTPTNGNLFFYPIGRAVRGRFVWQRIGEPLAAVAAKNWGGDIPGQLIELAGNDGAILEPLHGPDYAAMREKIAESGKALPPEREDFPGVDRNTWLYWLGRLVEAGQARVIEGELPAVDPSKAKRDFFEPAPDPQRVEQMQLIETVRAQGEQIAALVKAIARK
jgi:hypothetical protein